MKLNNGLRNTHSLKKTTYAMLRKLHSLEQHGALCQCEKLNDNYSIILCLQHLSDIIRTVYNGSTKKKELNEFCDMIIYLQNSASKYNHFDRKLLVSCLKEHTRFFNELLVHKIKPYRTQAIMELYEMKCVVAFVFQFPERR